MDANKTRFHLLLGRNDWADSTLEDGRPLAGLWSGSPPYTAPVAWDDRNAELTLTPRLFRFKSAAANRAPSIDDRRGAAADRYGNWYWIGPDRREILVNSSGTGLTSHFWSSTDHSRQATTRSLGHSPGRTRDLHGTHLRGAGGHRTSLPGCRSGGPAWSRNLRLASRRPSAPVAVAAGSPFRSVRPQRGAGGGLWLLDRDHGPMWVLDRTFSVVPRQTAATSAPDTFQSASGSAVRHTSLRRMPAGIPLGTNRAIAIQALPDNTVLILEPDRSRVTASTKNSRARASRRRTTSPWRPMSSLHRFRGWRPELRVPVAHRRQLALARSAPAVLPDALVRRQEPGRSGRQNLLRFAGHLGSAGRATAARATTRALFGLAQIRRQRARLRLAPAVARRLHPARIGCAHLVSRADNDPDRLAFQTWQLEPRLYQRFDGSEQPFLPRPADPDRGTWEVLPQRAKGRYLQLKLEVSGNGKTTPRLRALRIYYPRFSYLRNYLPRAYQEDAGSSSFLDRFLSNVEGFFTGIEDRIAFAQVLLDLRSATPDTLGWLASWFGLALDPSWTPDKQRLFLRHAMEFFQYRGTVRGLTMALRLALEDCADDRIFDPDAAARPGAARVTENFRKRQTPALAAPSSRWTPALGAPELNRRYAGVTGLTQYPISEPASLAAPWRDFSLRTLGFVPRISADDLTPWADFLSRRYRDVTQLNTAYGALNDSFSNVPLPQSLPVRDAPLRDWFEFQGLVLPMQAAAHRFTIMLPVPEQEAFDLAARRRRLDLTKRIIDLEKPAHTLYDIRFFWAFFRLGEARLGDDSVLDSGSRAPRLLPPMVLGEEFIGSSYFAPRPPQDATDRRILGRDVLRSKEQSL